MRIFCILHANLQQFGYQVLLIDDAAADLAKLKPTFITAEGLKAFVNGTEQVSRVTEQNFSTAPVQYTARAGNGSNIKNYWVSFVKKLTDAKLFVVVDGEKSGEREVFFDGYTDNHHDIFLSNIGDADLTGLKVELKDAQHVKLDDYWKVGGSGNDSLAPFATAKDPNWNHELQNIAKVRLLPDGEGEVSGTLVISSENGGSYDIALKGYAGNPKIITTTVSDAVKYVPYSFLIQTNNKYEWNKVTFRLDEGDLPKGLILRPSGEIYGIPTEIGTFKFTVLADYSSDEFESSYADLTLTVNGNTDQNVANQVDSGYKILDAVPRNLTAVQDYLFRSEGKLGEFIDFWVDGQKMEKGVGYIANEGSTAITIRAQTFQDFGSGTHTIAAEFRVDGDKNKDLKRTAQNYSLNLGGGQTGGGSNNGTSGTSTSTGGKGSSKNGGADAINAARQAATTAGTALQQLWVQLNNVNLVKLSEMQEISAIAKKEGKSPWLAIDSMLSFRKVVDVRIGINPSLATKDLYLAGSTQNKQAKKVKSLFEKFFNNKIAAVVNFSQKGDFGQTAVICIKAPKDTKVDELFFFAYDQETNTYRQIEKPETWVDQNGYLHFNTPYAGDIVISVGALVK